MKVVSKEGHCFNSRDEVIQAIFEHSGNEYTPEQLEKWTDAELTGWLGDLFSIYMEDLES